MVVHDRVRVPTLCGTTRCTKGGCKPADTARMSGADLSARWHLGRHHPKGQPSNRIGENPLYGMIGWIEETSASCEAATRLDPTRPPNMDSRSTRNLLPNTKL